ncbi:MAG: hypothetical protein JSR78_17335 [Proteobacteria bacterium]|nr:hypothetical protein [Pseudomonadota bacterium]
MAMPPRDNMSSAAAGKLRKAQEASQAMKEHEAERQAVRAKTERLRAERLAREAANPPPAKKKR